MIKATLLYRGRIHAIYAIEINNRCPVREFIDQLEDSEQKKVLRLLERSADHGLLKNEEKFKKLHEDIREFKSYQVRILCFFDKGGIIVTTHGFTKKRGKTPGKEIEKAIYLRKEYFKGKQNENRKMVSGKTGKI